MTQTEEKQSLCDQHQALLQIIMNYGNGAMLLPQARAICLALGLYPSAQAVNRAVRDLRVADILSRQTWVDNNSDLILACKYVRRYFSNGADSQGAATPRRPGTMAPYILQSRKINWLLAVVKKEGLASIQDVETYLNHRTCTMFLRLPDLLDFYCRHASPLAEERPEAYQEQVARLEASAAQRAAIASCEPSAPLDVPPVVTLEQMHRRGLYIIALSRKHQAVALALFAGRGSKAERIMDWAVDAQRWVNSLLPYYRSIFTIYALDAAHREALRAALTAPAMGRSMTPYWHDRLIAQHIDGQMQIAVSDTDFIRRWCGDVRRTDCF